MASTNPLLTETFMPIGESPAVGAGTDLSAVFTTDYLGETRITWDIGAIGYVVGEVPATRMTVPGGSGTRTPGGAGSTIYQ